VRDDLDVLAEEVFDEAQVAVERACHVGEHELQIRPNFDRNRFAIDLRRRLSAATLQLVVGFACASRAIRLCADPAALARVSILLKRFLNIS
jgi:hypothetical protein